MKNYGIDKKIRKEKFLYSVAKIQHFLKQYSTKDKKMREYHKDTYNRYFVNPTFFLHKDDYSIPKDKYCIPTCLLTSDLILREDIPKLKKGLKKLIKKHYSHKFLGGHHSIEEVLNSVENMDDTQTWRYTGIDAGRFDFETNKKLNRYISHFDLHIKNVNASYLAVEIHIYLTDLCKKDFQEIINDDVKSPKTYIISTIKRTRKKSGGENTLSVCNYNEGLQKSDNIYEKMVTLKWMFYQELQKFFPTVLHQLDSAPPSILLYKTNIDYNDKKADHFWFSLGVEKYNGQFIDPSQKLFFIWNLSGRYSKGSSNEMFYIYNDKKIECEAGFHSVDYEVVYYFTRQYTHDVFRFVLLDSYNKLFGDELIKYRAKLNRIKLNKNKLSKVLKLRYRFERDIDSYTRYCAEPIWEKSEKVISKLFDGEKIKWGYDYTYLIKSATSSMEYIQEQIEVVKKDFESKIEILKCLVDQKNESKGRRVNYLMLLLAIATLIFVIFPDWSKTVADFLSSSWNWLLDLLKAIKS